MEHCVFCRGSLSDGQPTVTIREKGSTSINQASEQRGDDIKTAPGQTVHSECRKQYCNANLISKYLREKANPTSPTPSRPLRSQSHAFNFQEHCLFCSKPVTCPGKKRSQDDMEMRCLDKIQEKLEAQKIQMATKRTSKLWLQYMEMVDILRLFIKAERTGDWMLHLKSLQEMLPFFAASGHNLYAKSAYIYVQQMLQLADSHPDVFAFFRSGYPVVCRSDRYWAGLSSDLVIEQTLMRTMKTTGRLTRGRGVAES